LEVFNFYLGLNIKQKRSVLIDTHKWKIILRWLPKPFGFEEILAKECKCWAHKTWNREEW
jgi:hypothetical protein